VVGAVRANGRTVTVERYDEISARRYAHVESRPDSFSLRMAPRIQRLFERHRPDRDDAPKMLDIGCGTGQLTDHMRRAGYITVGLDRSTAMLRHRVAARSGDRGAVATADAAQLPLVGRFELITATFNVINHLPSKQTVSSLMLEVARLLDPDGIFVFDINTALGLEHTAKHVEIVAGDDEFMVWTRHFDGERLILDASGSFLEGETRHRYRERIAKLVVRIDELERWCAQAGLPLPSWFGDDLETVLIHPEQHATAYGVIRAL
jgi:SAM-dependent methyltransferase